MVVGLSSTEYGVIPNTENIIDRVKSFQREREFLLLVAQVEIIVRLFSGVPSNRQKW